MCWHIFTVFIYRVFMLRCNSKHLFLKNQIMLLFSGFIWSINTDFRAILLVFMGAEYQGVIGWYYCFYGGFDFFWAPGDF